MPLSRGPAPLGAIGVSDPEATSWIKKLNKLNQNGLRFRFQFWHFVESLF